MKLLLGERAVVADVTQAKGIVTHSRLPRAGMGMGLSQHCLLCFQKTELHRRDSFKVIQLLLVPGKSGDI